MVGRRSFALERSDSPRHRSHVAQLFSLGGSHTFMSRSIHTTQKDLKRERIYAAYDEVPPTAGMTALEREDIQKRVFKLNANRKRQAKSQDSPAHAHLKLGESGFIKSARTRRAK